MSIEIKHEQGGGRTVNSDRLDAKQRAELAATMSDRLNSDLVALFLQRVSDAVDNWENQSSDGVNEKEMGRKLGKVETAARRLSSALSSIDERTFEHLAAHFDTLLYVGEPERPMPAPMRQNPPECCQWLNDQLEALRSIETVAEYAAEKITTTNDKRSNRRLRTLVRDTAWEYLEVFGSAPRESDWYLDFMRALGQQVDLTIGKEVVRGVLSDLK